MRILFHDLSTRLKTIKDLEREGRGGMVNSLFKVSDYLAWRGHDVTVLSDIEGGGVTNWGTKWNNEAWGHYDCLITNRGTGGGYPQISASSRILWTHDLPHSGFIPDPKTIRGYDCTVFMSVFAEKIWRTFYRTIGKSVQIPNGVTKGQFRPREKSQTLIYASAPNRGLDKLPLIHDALQTRLDRNVDIVAYSHLKSLHPGEVRNEDTYDYASIEESGVDWRYPIPAREFAQELGQACGLLIPSGYPEICSNVVLQALSCGTPVFGTGGMDATSEWVRHRHNGMLTVFRPEDYMVHIIEMVRNLVEYMESPRLQAKMQKRAAKTRVWSWKAVGAKWERLIKRCA